MKPRSQSPMEQCETEDEPGGPKAEKQKQRQGSVDREEILAPNSRLAQTSQRAPREPAQVIEKLRQLKTPRHAPRQDNGLQTLPEDEQKQNQADCNRQ